MDFFGMGMGEILLILVIALIVLGPGRIVGVGRTMGKAVRTLRKVSNDLTTQLSQELDGEKKDHLTLPGTGKNADGKETNDTDKA